MDSSSGFLILSTDKPTNAKRRGFFDARLISSAAVLLECCGVCGAFASLAESELIFLTVCCCLAVTAAEWFCRRSCRAFLIFNIALLSLCGVLPISFFDRFSAGFRRFLNLLFTLSEQNQAYRYDMFADAGDLPKLAFFFAISACALTAVCSIFALKTKRRPIVCALPAIAAFTILIWLGVFPPMGWDIVAAAGLLLLAFDGDAAGFSSYAILCAVVLLLSASICQLFSGNQAIRAFSDDIRDAAAFETVYESPAPETLTSKDPSPETVYSQNSGAVSDDSDSDGWTIETTPDFSGSRIGTARGSFNWIPFFCAVIIAILLIPAAKYLARMVKVRRARGNINDSDRIRAARCIFARLIDWLEAYGLETSNAPYSSYFGQLQTLMPGDYAEKYRGALELWQKAVYGGEDIGDSELERLRGFLKYTKRTVISASGPVRRLKYRLVDFL